MPIALSLSRAARYILLPISSVRWTDTDFHPFLQFILPLKSEVPKVEVPSKNMQGRWDTRRKQHVFMKPGVSHCWLSSLCLSEVVQKSDKNVL